MFYLIFGQYLVNNHILAKDIFATLQHRVANSNVRLGIIAASEGLLTTTQAEELNRLQAVKDIRFGDLAVEQGYLTEEQVSSLLKLQGNTFLQFVQLLIDEACFTMEDINTHMKSYQADHHLSDSQMTILKTGDFDSELPILIKVPSALYFDHLALVLRNIVRFISNDFYILDCKKVDSFEAEHIAMQQMKGSHDIILGFAATGNHLLSIANPFAKEDFTQVDDDAYDSVCEFINCINGIFATKLSENGIQVELLPPTSNYKLLVKGTKLYILSLVIEGHPVDLFISIDSPMEFSKEVSIDG